MNTCSGKLEYKLNHMEKVFFITLVLRLKKFLNTILVREVVENNTEL